MPSATDSGMRIVSLVLLLTAAATANERWDRHKGDCDGVFRGWRTTAVERIRDCVMSFEMYRDVTEVDDDERAVVHEALDKLYREGDKRDATMALSAMKRLGVRPRKLRAGTGAVPEGPAREAVPVIGRVAKRGSPSGRTSRRCPVPARPPSAPPTTGRRSVPTRKGVATRRRASTRWP